MLRTGIVRTVRQAGSSRIAVPSRTGLRGFSASCSALSSHKDTATGVDPGYVRTSETVKQEEQDPPVRPSTITDPFPLPFDPRLEGLSLSSDHQSQGLAAQHGAEEPIPLRVPGREPGQESREVKIARIIWQTRKRGTLEADLLLSTFAKKELKGLSEAEIEEFDVLLDEPDWDLFYWMTDRKPVADRWKESFQTEGRLGWRLRKHARNEERELRKMPTL